MTSASQMATFRALIESFLSDDRNELAKQRIAITRSLEAIFFDIAVAAKPELALEIGAHEANFSRMIKAAMPECEVCAVEANPLVHRQYSDDLGKLNIGYLHTCVGSSTGTVQLKVPVRKGVLARKMGSIYQDSWAEEHESFAVDMVRLDDIHDRHGAANILWIDVEGAVREIIEGGPETLSSCVALYAEIETQKRWSGQAVDTEILPALESFGLQPLLCDVQRHFQFNVICLRPDAFDDKFLQQQKKRFMQDIRAVADRP